MGGRQMYGGTRLLDGRGGVMDGWGWDLYMLAVDGWMGMGPVHVGG